MNSNGVRARVAGVCMLPMGLKEEYHVGGGQKARREGVTR